MLRLAALVLFAATASAAASAQEADPTPPWRYDPVGVGNARSYFQDISNTPYWRTDSPTAVTRDGQRWTVRRTQWFSRVELGADGWSRTEARVLVRYDTTAANVLVRSEGGAAGPLYPCRLDVPLTPPEGGTCGEGVRYVKTGDGRLAFPGNGNGFATVLEAGLGVVRESTDRRPDANLVGAVIDGDTLLAEPDAFPNSRPNPTPASRYVPMSVGDEWQYVNYGIGNGARYRRVDVIGTQEIEGQRYFGLRQGTFARGEGDWTYAAEPTFARFDTLTARVVTLNDDSDRIFDCPFDEPVVSFGDGGFFGDGGTVYCTTESSGLGSSVADGGEGIVRVGGDTFVTALRSFPYTGIADGACDPDVYAAGIGYVGYTCPNAVGPQPYEILIYARVRQPDGSVLELGRPYAVDADDAPEPGRLALTVGPNPAVGPATLRLAAPAGGAVQWEAFDALGRRVWQRAETVAAGETARSLDVSGWPPGLYVVRATVASGAVTATVVRR